MVQSKNHPQNALKAQNTLSKISRGSPFSSFFQINGHVKQLFHLNKVFVNIVFAKGKLFRAKMIPKLSFEIIN